ncbi:MAG: hypothetical protein AAF499_07060, partial [Pseudomonadota bacterium]
MWVLIQEGVNDRAYCDQGWIHAGLLRMLELRGIGGVCRGGVSTTTVFDCIERGNVCIASVTVDFRGGRKNPNGQRIPRGGHLVVVNGAKRVDGVSYLRCHHPSSSVVMNLANEWVPEQQFRKSFSGNIVEVHWGELFYRTGKRRR